MKTRIITAIFILAVMIPVLIFSHTAAYPIALSVFAVIAVFEMLRAFGSEKRYARSIPAYIMAAAFPSVHFFLKMDSKEYILILAAAVFAYLLYVMGVGVFSGGRLVPGDRSPEGENTLSVSRIGEVFMTVTYIVVSFTALSMLRYAENGGKIFMLVFIVAWGCDTAAYFVGFLIGRHKLIPAVSPKKTVEGAIGGIFFAVIFCVLYGLVIESLTDVSANYVVLAISGAVLSVVSQVGDLIASLIKREHGIKDYSNLMPGHGGIMDRFDSILAVSTPLMFICLVFPPFS